MVGVRMEKLALLETNGIIKNANEDNWVNNGTQSLEGHSFPYLTETVDIVLQVHTGEENLEVCSSYFIPANIMLGHLLVLV